MPCSSEGYETENDHRARAMLCALFSTLESKGFLDKVLDDIDFDQAGYCRESFIAWWNEHKAADQRRLKEQQQAEAKAFEQEVERHKALSKLTFEERRALGLIPHSKL